MLVDQSLHLLAKGYAWAPDLRRARGGGPVVATRLLGKKVSLLHGREAVGFFYDEDHVSRVGALPEPLLSTLFGHGPVHTLDGAPHQVRKNLFVSLLKDPESVAALARTAEKQWERSEPLWAAADSVVLFDEAGLLLTRAVCEWAGVPVAEEDEAQLARDLLAMVDGFATVSPRHLAARRARARQETRLADLVRRTREGPVLGAGEVLQAIAGHRGNDGALLDERTAAVELLNVLRPTVAVAWFLTFAAHALHRWPRLREELAAGGPAEALAFAHELRRFYPFAPFVGGLAARDLEWQGHTMEEGSMVLLDIYGYHHDPELWENPYTFDPGRFRDRQPEMNELIPQGGGPVSVGHRCPGEDITVALLQALVPRLAALRHEVPEQDLTVPLTKIPTRPRSGYLIRGR